MCGAARAAGCSPTPCSRSGRPPPSWRWSSASSTQYPANACSRAAFSFSRQGALGRAGQDCGRLDGHLVEQVIAGQPLVLSDEQAAAVRALTTSGAGVDVLIAGAGSGKTCAVLGSVRRAYELAGYRVVGAASSARAARVLADDGGLAACTVARLLLDLDRPPAGGLGPGTVLVLDEASMVGTRDMAAVLGHAEAAGAKVIVVGDTRQLAAVDAGGGLRALADRLGAQRLTANRRQHAGWERVSVESIAKTFKLRDFAAALALVNKIGAEADKRDHHPDIELGYGRARVLWTTHDAGGLSARDVRLARAIDRL